MSRVPAYANRSVAERRGSPERSGRVLPPGAHTTGAWLPWAPVEGMRVGTDLWGPSEPERGPAVPPSPRAALGAKSLRENTSLPSRVGPTGRSPFAGDTPPQGISGEQVQLWMRGAQATLPAGPHPPRTPGTLLTQAGGGTPPLPGTPPPDRGHRAPRRQRGTAAA